MPTRPACPRQNARSRHPLHGTQVTGGVCGNSALTPVQAAAPAASMIGAGDIGAIARDWAASLVAAKLAQGPEAVPPPPAYPAPNSAAAYANAASKAAEESQAAIALAHRTAREEAAARKAAEEPPPRAIPAPKVIQQPCDTACDTACDIACDTACDIACDTRLAQT